MRQYKDSDWTPQDQFTMTPSALGKAIQYLKNLVATFKKVHSQQQNQPGGQRPAQAPAPQHSTPPNMAPLNASNLQQHQQQQEEAMRARRAQVQNVSTAPPALRQPFPLGVSSPQGVPQAYGPGGFSPERLKIPLSKRRRQNHGASPTVSPVQAPGPVTPAKTEAVKPEAAKVEMAKTEAVKPEVLRAVVNMEAEKAEGAKLPSANTEQVDEKPFKCAELECEYHEKGFPNQILLDNHNEESHQVLESISNPLEYAMESFQALVAPLKEKDKGQPKDGKKTPAAAADMQRAPSKTAASSAVRVDGMTPTATGIASMKRDSSQAGPKSVSPMTNQLLLSRAPSGRGLVQPNMKPSASNDGKTDGKLGEQAAASDDVVMKDSWADSAVSIEAIGDTFTDFGDDRLRGLGLDPIDEFINSDMFTKIQNKDTPDSIDSGAITQTPRDGDSSQDEDIDVKIGGITDDSWIPVDWNNLPGRFEDGLFMTEPWDDVDWETIEHKEADFSNIDDGAMAICSV
jgi:hypothetical protein